MERIYLDNNATTALHPKVKSAISDALELFGNPSSHHAFGRSARGPIEEARENIAKLINASPDQLIFTSGGSEANNLVLRGVACRDKQCTLSCGEKPGKHIITSVIEHPSVLETCRCLEHSGVEVTYIGVDETGRIRLKELEEAIRPETAIISIMYANNEVGTIQPIAEIGEIAHKHGIKFHTDAVQAVGKIPVDVKKLNVDYLSLSGHKLHGPKGIGALYVKPGSVVCPLISGGHQEGGFRAGTENTLGIIGFGASASLALADEGKHSKQIATLRDRLEKGIVSNILDIKINGNTEYRLPNTLNVSFSFIEGEAILFRLDAEGIAVSTGSACSSGSLDPSHVLLAMHLPIELAHGSIRFSLSHDTTEAEIDYVIGKLETSIDKLRRLSPLYRKPS